MFAPLPPGSLVGRYRVERVVGSGGMGVVHAAHDEHLDRRVALKVMSGHLAGDATFRERFVREATVLGQLDSPHIVQVYDHGEVDGNLWIATQFIDGGDLAQLIARHGPLPVPLAARVCAEVADALQEAHARGIVHRDVKPGNILLAAAESGEPHTYLTDFGLAREIGAELTSVRSTTGTWDYLAPECGAGQQATPASDIYAVGCLLWTCLTGRPPYDGTEVEVALAHARQTPPTLTAGASIPASEARRLNAVLTRAMSKDPSQRHASAGELAADLRAVTAGEGPTRTLKRWGAVLAAAAVAVTVLGVVVAVKALQPDDNAPAAEAKPTSETSAESTAPEPVDRPVTGDVDGDGFGDLILRPNAAAGGGVGLLRSSGGTSLGDQEPWAEGTGIVVRGDVDGDDRVDLLSVSTSPGVDGKWHIAVLRDGVAAVQNTDLKAPRGSSAFDSALGDFDGDGLDDLALRGGREPADRADRNVVRDRGRQRRSG